MFFSQMHWRILRVWKGMWFKLLILHLENCRVGR